MDDLQTRLEELQLHNAALEAENERLRNGGFSRRQLLAGGAGVMGAVAGAGLLGGRAASAESALAKPSIHAMLSTKGAMIFAKITGKAQGVFPGDSTIKGHENQTSVLFFDYEVLSPRDVATGQPTGKRQHKPLTIVKEWGAASPQLYQALATNESLTQVVFDFFTLDTQGAIQRFFNVTLTNASISDFHPYLSDTADRHNSTAQGLLIEEVSFTFQKIVWTSIQGNKSFQDSWST